MLPVAVLRNVRVPGVVLIAIGAGAISRRSSPAAGCRSIRHCVTGG
jgi:hypothetical protein